jgi:RecB family endonuclease NucS
MSGRKVVRRFSNARLEAVRVALFPDEVQNPDGSTTILDADENLDAAIYDLKRTKADAVCIRTLEKILARLIQAREALTEGRRDIRGRRAADKDRERSGT